MLYCNFKHFLVQKVISVTFIFNNINMEQMNPQANGITSRIFANNRFSILVKINMNQTNKKDLITYRFKNNYM